MKIKLAEALLKRKELQAKVEQLNRIRQEDWTEILTRRIKVTDGIDEFTASVPRVNASDLTAEYDYYAKRLREIDALIQQTNWTAEIELDGTVREYYKKVTQ